MMTMKNVAPVLLALLFLFILFNMYYSQQPAIKKENCCNMKPPMGY